MREPANIDAIIDLMDRTPEEMDAQNVPAPVRDRILRIPGSLCLVAHQSTQDRPGTCLQGYAGLQGAAHDGL